MDNILSAACVATTQTYQFFHLTTHNNLLSSSSSIKCSFVKYHPRKAILYSIGKNLHTLKTQSHCHFGLLLLSSLLLSWWSGMSTAAPLNNRSDKDSPPVNEESKPHWIHPCPGLSSADVVNSPVATEQQKGVSNMEEETASDGEIIGSIILTAKHAIRQAELFREQYVLKTFNVEIWAHHNMWRTNNYAWLRKDMTIPKDLGEIVPKQNLENLQLEDEALKIYSYLQRLSVAFEQITNDNKKQQQDPDFKEEFSKAENHLKLILCELRDIIPETKWSMFEDASRDIMGPEYRHMDNLTHQHLRDWLIFRDYMNLVEYIIQVMEYFKSKLI